MTASTTAYRTSSTQSMELAQAFANEIDLYGNFDKANISSYFSGNAEFVITTPDDEEFATVSESVTFQDFFEAIALIFTLRVKQIADWQDSFKSSETLGEKTITWVSSGSREIRYITWEWTNGVPYDELNIEWQWVSSTMVLEFAEEENKDEGEASDLSKTVLKIRRC